ncbi:hypothetical protein FLP10_11395 [Agromyces intestinalis]|uniref:ATPase BadF/BadG/BcrA/BcrD type domain-containing protein n=1 Tax=Agromyces intestinalis TaxID=2592652 RepID=A0A5C1YHB3_9MICO|nr:BadF/BadG/BcrA/BcrD ATPase family protein [Agromyces intestinalis]QEO14955.1 hypothetical protein FLP10_11395 [Agromyces intestinalis]
MTYLLGIDVGGSGSRVALRRAAWVRDVSDVSAAPDASRLELLGDRIGVTAEGSTVPDAVLALIERAAAEWPDEFAAVEGVGVGATGLATLVERPADLVAAVERAFARLAPGRSVGVAVAIDAVTGHLGALAGEGGVVVALGTGAIAFGTDCREVWRRVDGWGHLLGDRGGAAWIGLRALDAAVRAHDGVDPAGAALLEAARARFGEVLTWPSQLYTRADRAGVLAGFAADVARVAEGGDPVASAIIAEAGAEAARSAIAALDPALPGRVAATGGVFGAGGGVAAAFARALAAARPDVELVAPAGDPLDGALILAERAAAAEVTTHVPYVWANR